MNILVTGAKGFVGRNLVENLKTLADGRNGTRPGLEIGEVYEYDAPLARSGANAKLASFAYSVPF